MTKDVALVIAFVLVGLHVAATGGPVREEGVMSAWLFISQPRPQTKLGNGEKSKKH